MRTPSGITQPEVEELPEGLKPARANEDSEKEPQTRHNQPQQKYTILPGTAKRLDKE